MLTSKQRGELIGYVSIGLEVGQIAMRALEASNNGDQAEADKFLAEARAKYSAARKAWDAA